MTEKEKRDAGMLFDAANDPALNEEMIACKDKCHEYNQTKPSDLEKRSRLIKSLMGSIGNNFTILAPVWCDYGYNIEIGDNFFSNHNLVILDGAKVKFGDNVLIGPDCGFYTAAHSLDAERRGKGYEYDHPIIVGNNVWFGGGVRVMPGVKIGNNVVIGSGSVVTKDIPDDSLAMGNPCHVIRKITEKDKETEYYYQRFE